MPGRFLLTFLALMSLAHTATAQSATLRGRVVDESNEAIDGANVVLRSTDGTVLGMATQDGYYLLARIPAGTYTLRVSFVGYEAASETLQLNDGDNLTRNFTLVEDPSQLGQLVVEGERTESREAIAGLRTIRGADLGLLPSPALSRDLASSLVSEAGVVTVGDRGGQLFIRGGTPSENIFLLDGMRIFQPLHLVNAFSVYPADIVAFADVYSSGYGAYYGGRTGAVVDVTTRNGNKQRISGSASVAPFLAAVHLEIPVVTDRVSFLTSVRQSLLSDYGPRVIGEELPYRYGDRYFKLHGFLSETSNVSVTALRSNDRGSLAGDIGIEREIAWSNEAYGANFFYLAPSLPVFTEITIGTTRFSSEKLDNDEVAQSSSVEGIEGSFNFGYLLGTYQVHFGIFAQSTKFRYALSPRRSDRFAEFVTEGGMFLETRFEPSPGWHFVPGARIQTFPSRGQSYLEPRFRFTVPVDFAPGVSLTGAWGIYHQELIGLTDDRTVSDVFTAWAPSEENQAVPKSTHYALGLTTDQGRWRASLEGYSRTIENLGFPALGEPLSVNTRYLSLEGFSRGVDAGLEYRWPRAFARLSYGLGQTTYRDQEIEFAPPHDRRHSLSLTGQIDVRGYRVAAQWHYGSGLPFTQINGGFQRLPVDRETPTPDEAGEFELLFGQPFSARLPAYHRLDVSLERDIVLPAGARLTLHASAVNSYNRSNWFDLDYDSLERLNQLPFIPSFGAQVKF